LEEKDQVIEVLDKAITILEGLAGREYEPMTLAELTEKSGLDKTGIYRILKTLEVRGWTEQVEKSWRLTTRYIRFAEDYRLGRDNYFRKLDERDHNYLGRV
jgi:DNA-binding IclR family transcriptional regulator